MLRLFPQMSKYAYSEFLFHSAAPARRWMRAFGPHIKNLDLPAAREIGAGFEVIGHSRPRFSRPAYGIDEVIVDGKEIAVIEETLLDKPFCRLLRFNKKDCVDPGPPMLIVAPLSGHFSTYIRGTISAMLERHDVYVVCWKNARDVPMWQGTFDLDDFTDYLLEFFRFLYERVGRVHVMSVCQPGVPVLVAVSLMAADNDGRIPRSMIKIASPIDARKCPTDVSRLAIKHSLEWFEDHAIWVVPPPHLGVMRRVYPGILQLMGFMSLDFERHIDAHVDRYKHLVADEDEEAAAILANYDEFGAVLDLPAEFYVTTVERIFQKFWLPRGVYRHRGVLIDPAAIGGDVGLMTIEGATDTITGRGQCEAVHDLTPRISHTRRSKLVHPKVGHTGVFTGSRFRQDIQPEIEGFVRALTTSKLAA